MPACHKTSTGVKRASARYLTWFAVVSSASVMVAIVTAADNLQPGAVLPGHGSIATRPAFAGTRPAQIQPTGPQPKYRCDQAEFNFGTVWAGEKVEHTWTIHNDGKGVLTVDAHPTCGCTVAEFDKTVQPGADGKVKAVLTNANYTAPVHKAINVTTNDMTLPNGQAVLTLVGNVKQKVSSEPPLAAYFGTFTPGMNLVKTFKLTNNTDKPMKIEVVPPATPSCFKVSVKDIDPGKTAELTAKVEEPLKDGVNAAQFMIKTGLENVPDLPLPCNIVNPPAVEVQPTVVRLAAPLTNPLTQPVTLRNNSKTPVKLISAECSDERVKVQTVENAAGRLYTINLAMPKDYAPDPAKPAVLTLSTDYKPNPIYKVSIVSVTMPRPPVVQPVMVTPESLVGRPVPSAAPTTLEGQAARIGTGTNQVMLLNFWAPWCTHSRTQTPMLEKLYQNYRRKGVEFINISEELLRPAAEQAAIVRDLDGKIPVALDPQRTIAKLFGVTQFPMMFLVGKNGTVEAVRRGIGRTPADLEDMAETLQLQLDKLLENKTRTDFPAKQQTFGPTCALDPIPAAPQPNVPGVMRSPGAAPASLYVESLQQDAGMFKPKSQGQYKVYLRNTGSQPLQIRGVTGSSQLKIDPSYQKVLPPEASVSLNCTFETPAKPERFLHQLAIESNDPIRPTLNVAIAGQSRPLVQVEPPTGVDFGNKPRLFSVRIATLLCNGDEKVEYAKPESSSPKFEADIQSRENKVGILTVKALPPFEQGETTATITIKTNLPEQPVVEVPVRLYMPRRIEVTPSIIRFTPQSSPQQVAVTIANSGSKAFNILDVTPSQSQIQTQYSPETDGLSYRLQVTLPPNYRPGMTGDRITIRTNDQEYGEIVVGLTAN